MKIVLATGIYPPQIGGPATYSHALAQVLHARGVNVHVVTYGEVREEEWPVHEVGQSGGPLARWKRYSTALRTHAADADCIIAFSSVSCGMPLKMAGLTGPKMMLRLGGDFCWERYTDRGGMKGLRAWYEKGHRIQRMLMQWILRTFDHIVFSTRFQENLYEEHYRSLPPHSVIENALPTGIPVLHEQHKPFRVLYMGRLVGFKNLSALVCGVRKGMMLTVVGEGPMHKGIERDALKCQQHFNFVCMPPAYGAKKQEIFAMNDLLIIPSLTEISPNTALEARSVGLPVLLTRETGLSAELLHGMIIRDLSTPEQIAQALQDIERNYEQYAREAAKPPLKRGWDDVAEEWVKLCKSE